MGVAGPPGRPNVVASRHKDAKIQAIQQLASLPSSYRVNFHYGSGGKQVQSSLILTIRGSQVVDVNSEL